MCKIYKRARGYERAHGLSGLWLPLAFGRVGGRGETAGFVSNRLELVVEKGRPKKMLGLRARTKRFLLDQDTAGAAACCCYCCCVWVAVVGDERMSRLGCTADG